MKFGKNDIVGGENLSPGDEVQFVWATGGKGMAQAREVTLLTPGSSAKDLASGRIVQQNTGYPSGGPMADFAVGGPTTVGTVKSFSEKNGYGFIVVEGQAE